MLIEMRYFVRFIAGLGALISATGAVADHAILHEGDTLFNVIVDDRASTWSRPLRIRYKPASFRYDYRSHSVTPLLGHGEYHYVADYITTTVDVSKQTARRLVEQNQWHRYMPPPSVALTPIPVSPVVTPAPTPVATKVADVGVTTTVASPLLPIDERIRAQLEMFISEERSLRDLINYSIKVGALNQDQAKAHRLALLQKQLQTLTSDYPSSNNLVQRAREALENEIKSVNDKGRFTFEEDL